MTESLTDARLDEIAAHAGRLCRCEDEECAADLIQLGAVDVPTLIAELRDLRARIAAARAEIREQGVAAMHATGQCPCNSVPRAVSDALAAVETHLVDPEHRPSRAWLLWSPGGTLADITEYEQPVTRAHAQQRHDDDADLPAGSLEPVPAAALPEVRATWRQAVDQGRTITRDDLKGILP